LDLGEAQAEKDRGKEGRLGPPREEQSAPPRPVHDRVPNFVGG